MLKKTTADKIFSSLNTDIPEFPFPVTKGMTESCYDQVEDYLQFGFKRLPVEFVSRRELADQVFSLAQDLESLIEAKKPVEAVTEDPDFLGQAKGIALGLLKKGETEIGSAALAGLLKILSGKILGIYVQRYTSELPPRLLIVPENIMEAAGQLDVDPENFLKWVLTHEMTHVAQMDPGAVIHNYTREQIQRFATNATPGNKKAAVQEITGVMSYIEGMADFVMDREGILTAEEIEDMRERMDARRMSRPVYMEILMKIMGSKDQQYIQGKRFCEDIVSLESKKALTAPMFDAELIPSKSDITNPIPWIKLYRAKKS